ncbi:ABC transporter ATP-binding protein [Methanobacterium formicicum]|uniref:Xenobiotic-transporting ATPase n=1 Tax=Methanobacterium formicicum TaxID=2162 RepID=A0A090JT93_METFO|nr:ABC transporter ATP-binding protein [Methanobacterium formicicum]MDH2659149.1 ABC transporter ATP-binding protein [Methanobacterium formicicum]CEA12626.1 xenobiotic-transporting ATPase [Methanobacterium formicicum]
MLNFKNSLMGEFTENLISLMPRKVALALTLMVILSLNEAVSLLILVPLLGLVGLDVGQGSLGQIDVLVSNFFSFLGLQPTLVLVLILYVVVISVSALLTRYQTLQTSQIQYQFANHLRQRLYNAITNSSWLFFSRMKSSSLAHALTNEIERISTGTGQFLTFIASIMILVVYIIFALELAGLFTGVIFAVGIVILLVLRRRASRSRTSGEDITTTTRDLYYSILQHLDGMKTIKSFGMQDENKKIFKKQSNQVAGNYLQAIRSYADVKLLFDVGTVIVLALMVFILIEVVKLPTASLFLLIYLFVRMIPQFSTVQRAYQYFINMLPAFGNVSSLEEQFLDNSESKEKDNGSVEFKESIKLENVFFSYGDENQFTLDNLNLEIPAGKTIALAGPSGAGKSTVADLVMGLISPDQGKVTVDGKPITPSSVASWRNRIGYVAQETFLFNETIRFNLKLARPDASEDDLKEALKMAAAYDFVSKLPEGMDTVIGDRGVRLSGGERQRLALARALLRKPSLLIMDEATSNLDSDNEKKILKAIDDIHGEITILMIAHRISTIKNADIIHLIDKSEIMESGTWQELSDKGIFWDLPV